MAQRPIIASRFCVPNPSYLSITKASGSNGTSSYCVTDVVNQNLIFKVQWKRKFLDYHNHMLLLDPAGNTIVKLRLKPGTHHSRWQVFRGDSDVPLFSAKQSSNSFYKTKLDGFLAHNRAEKFRDFSVQATWKKAASGGVIYAGDNTSTILAEMQTEYTQDGCCFCCYSLKEFKVTVRPNIDYAFIVAVIVILHVISSSAD